jgi:hypothetical protein
MKEHGKGGGEKCVRDCISVCVSARGSTMHHAARWSGVLILRSPLQSLRTSLSSPFLAPSLVCQNARMNLLTTEDFSNTFGPKAQRKKPKLSHSSDVDMLLSHVSSSASSYELKVDPQLMPLHLTREVQLKDAAGQKLFGQSTHTPLRAIVPRPL